MPNFADFIPEKKDMLCFVGKAGHGKSLGASYWPIEQGNRKGMFYASCDGRVAAVYNWWADRDPQRLKSMDFEVYTAGDYDKIATKMEKLQIKCPYATVVIDPLTMVADMLIQFSIAVRGGGGGDKEKNGVRIQIAQPDDYKTEAAGLKRIMDAGRVLPCHFILCAHILEDIYYPLGEEKPRITRRLMTAGKAPGALVPAMFDEVWLFTVENDPVIGKPPHYIIATRPSQEFDVLRTSCNMPPIMDWTNKDLYKVAGPYLRKERAWREDATEKKAEVPAQAGSTASSATATTK